MKSDTHLKDNLNICFANITVIYFAIEKLVKEYGWIIKEVKKLVSHF